MALCTVNIQRIHKTKETSRCRHLTPEVSKGRRTWRENVASATDKTVQVQLVLVNKTEG